MKANIVDLRYKMREVLMALDRNETVTILYRGKEKAILGPINSKRTVSSSKLPSKTPAKHPFFGMFSEETKDVKEIMEMLRGGRFK